MRRDEREDGAAGRAGGWIAALRSRAAMHWRMLIESPGGPSYVARGGAAGVFAGMLPAFGAHLLLAILLAFLIRGGRGAAAAACLLVGNPLTHAVILPTSYEIGRWLLPDPPGPHATWLPAWAADLVPVAEEALAGGVVLGLLVAPPAFLILRAVLRREAARMERREAAVSASSRRS
ncbi:DUF2062 domain-containing protein [Roseomonas sp. AR75]|uniref:DUF2062 domain-containing protein n=1 Tax=Roseomonas sp. AR75 TaxID=2562311 RepID=UPI0014859F72|nr:DUF2062 domain-containing protein [Roseomonas sp. AR75]